MPYLAWGCRRPFDGDGRADFVYYHAPSLTWWILSATTWQGTAIGWGLTSGDIAVPADYDGDGLMDLAGGRTGVRARGGRGGIRGPRACGAPARGGDDCAAGVAAGGTCLVDGTDVGRVPVPWPAASDSSPGAWVGAGTDVRVSGLSILGVPPAPREPR